MLILVTMGSTAPTQVGTYPQVHIYSTSTGTYLQHLLHRWVATAPPQVNNYSTYTGGYLHVFSVIMYHLDPIGSHNDELVKFYL